jgi:N-acetylated-alpha-linked acidic dipeptidase
MDDVKDPQTGVSIKERRYAKTVVDADKSARAKLVGNKYYKLNALGAGSDYSPFIQHLGITSIDLGFGGENPGGEYHSVYDTYDLFTRFKDPGFQYGVALAKTAGRVTMRLANADALPLDFNSFYKTLNDYAAEVKTLLDNQRTETESETRMIRDNLFNLAKDPKKTYAPPVQKEAVPYLNFSELDNELVKLKGLAEEYQKAYSSAAQLPVEKQNQLNDLLYKAERNLVAQNGLPRRPWYRHQIYAPGYYTGYGVKTLPAIREAIEQRNWKEAQEGISTVTQTIQAYNTQVQKAIAIMGKASF